MPEGALRLSFHEVSTRGTDSRMNKGKAAKNRRVRFPSSAYFCTHEENRMGMLKMAYLCGSFCFPGHYSIRNSAASIRKSAALSFHEVSTKLPVSFYVNILRDISDYFLFVLPFDIRDFPVIVLIEHSVGFPSVDGLCSRPGHLYF